MEDDDLFRLSAYLHKSSGYIAKTNAEEIYNDHSYGRAPNWRQDYVFAKPYRTLFVHPSNNFQSRNEEDNIDVEYISTSLTPIYNVPKAFNLMEECDKHVNFQHPDDGNPDWEDHISRSNWTNMQTRLFNKVVRVLHNDQLARLANHSTTNEPVLRRITCDKTARRLRQIFASVVWNIRYTQWLHNLLMDNLHASYLVSYLDALQALKSKVPTLVDRMLAGSSTRSALTTPIHELLNIVYKRPWDPLSVGLTHYKPRKLPLDPILVMVPTGPGSGNISNSRSHHWMANLSTLGTVVCVYSSPGRVVGKVSVVNCLDHMLASTRAKLTELREDYGDKPIVLVGIGSGATLAYQVAMVENVTAVVCLGFPLYTVEDSRGTPDDTFLNLQVPVLFVIGQDASTSSLEDMEDLREKLNVVTSLLLVGGADDQLRLTKAKKKLDGVTQSVVDKCIMDEVADFLGTLLSPDYIHPVRPTVVHPIETSSKRTIMKTFERKRKYDVLNPSNQDSISTPAKKGRKPKIPIMQKMVQNKWTNQLSTPKSEVSPTLLSAATSSTSQMTSVNGSNKHVVLDKKGLQLSIQNNKVQQPTSSESTITVVAASSPNISDTSAVKSRFSSGQLTSLSSILQPGTRGVISPCPASTSDDSLSLRSLTSSISNPPNIVDELNILDMPVILGDQNPEETSTPQQPSPVKFILTNNQARTKQGVPTIKYLNQTKQPVKCTKIYVSKSDNNDHKSLYVGEVHEDGISGTKPRIRHIPATKHLQFH